MKYVFLSIFCHSLLFAGYHVYHHWEQKDEPIHISLEEGALGLGFHFSNPSPSPGNNSKLFQSSSSALDGTVVRNTEIEEFKKRLSYPKVALEQGLEDDCSFRVAIDQNGFIEKVVETEPCRFQVFSMHFRTQSQGWQFAQFRSEEIIIPVRFKIDERD